MSRARARVTRRRRPTWHGISIPFLLIMTAKLLSAEMPLDWRQLPSIPDPLGVAGPYAGVSGDALIVAGGANFPDKMPWEGGHKVWHDTAFVLDRTNGVWRGSFKLPKPLGYGVSVTTPDGVICVGGSDSTQHVADVFLLSWRNGELKHEPLAPLPESLANSCGAVVGQTLYVAGGTATPDATNALKNFWSLDLAKRDAQWQVLEPWPGPSRMLSVAAALGGSFYVAGGTDLYPDAAGKPVRTYLKDAYRFTPGAGWRRVADMPNPVVAAPTPAPATSATQFLVIGGDDGSLAGFEPKSKHPGFPKRVLCYDTASGAWSVVGETPASRATLPVVPWQGLFVIASGEARPGVRSPEVWAFRTKNL